MSAMMTKKIIGSDREATPLRATSLTGESLPQRVLLAPWGEVESSNGRFFVDEESAQAAIETFEKHGTDLPIDYEHQTLGGGFSSPTGRAPAAGWIKRLVAEPDVGIFGEIEWTEQARTMILAKEYRYLSPVAMIRKSDRKLVAIHSAALTNKPAIVNMLPIANREEFPEDVDRLETLAALRSELQLSPCAAADEVLVAASHRLAELRADVKRRHVDQRLHEAMRAGKLVEAQRAWAEALVASEENLFDEWLRTAPTVVQPGRTELTTTGGVCSSGQAAGASARAEFRAHKFLADLTSEEAYVQDALRQRRSA